MLKRVLALGLVLSVASVANAGYSIDVILPAEPVGGYVGGETIQAQIGLTATGESQILARLMTLDFAASSGDLGFANWSWLPAYENGQSICTLVPALCGNNHVEFNNLPKVNTTYTGISADTTNQIIIPGDGQLIVGQVDVTLPMTPGDYTIDAVNNAAPDTNSGARIDYDFANPTTIHGTFDGGSASVSVVPEPATLALLGVGGIAALRRRKN